MSQYVAYNPQAVNALVKILLIWPTTVMNSKGIQEARERAARLAAIRTKLHNIKSQRQFAAELGIPYPRYNNWERGHPITVNEAKRIRDATPGVTGDYILWGIEDGLSVETWRKLRSDSSDK
jgi:hypothetical protein